MRAKIIALALASLAASVAIADTTTMSSRHPDANPSWAGCVIARQVAPNGATMSIDRVCSKNHREFSIFEPYQFGERPMLAGAMGATALIHAKMNFVAFISDYAPGDGRKARLELSEAGPAGSRSSYTYDLSLRVGEEAMVNMPSGISIGLRMDPQSLPTGYDAALSMPTAR